MRRRIFTVRFWLSVGLFLSVLFSAWSIYYKSVHWGFNLSPHRQIPVWTIEAHLSFQPNGKPIRVELTRPTSSDSFRVLEDTVRANDYVVIKEKDKMVLTADPLKNPQNIYYRISVYDNHEVNGNLSARKAPQEPILPDYDDTMMPLAQQVLSLVKDRDGDFVTELIQLFNQVELDEEVVTFMPERKTGLEFAHLLTELLAIEKMPARIIRGIRLEEGKKASVPDVMVEVYSKEAKHWQVYDITTGETGIPDNFVVLQRGGASLVDVTGGVDSQMSYSVLKSLSNSFNMAKYRAKSGQDVDWYAYSVFDLPINQQNSLKWLMVFPLAILIVVILRNVVGLKTMGTFTPMLIAMSLVETGLFYGLAAFVLIVGTGLLIRTGLSRLNLLLVPRISAVVIFVIIIIQICAVLGYRLDWKVASSVLFFPIIIIAWVIERASIIWEEEGLKNAAKEVFYSVVVAVITYFVIMNQTIRHIMFAFNELNLVILFAVMLLGTYTGYRLTELRRFAPLCRKEKK